MVTFARIDALILQLSSQSAWTDWSELEGCWRGKTVEDGPGLYRLQLVVSNLQEVVYIGQSGDLRKRMSMLNGIFAEEMPYRSPHVAGPPLWAMRHQLQQRGAEEIRFEVSFVPLPGIAKPLRLGLECVAIALHRQRYQRSPRANYGRMIAGYKTSSFNTAQLVKQEKRFRGGPTTELLECHRPGIAPVGLLTGDPHTKEWGGHSWTPWVKVFSLRPVGNDEGLYRLRMPDCDPLLLIGSGKLTDRLQGYRQYSHLECSWVIGSWYPHQRLELICDLLATHLLVTQTIPLWQFESTHDGPGGESLRKVS